MPRGEDDKDTQRPAQKKFDRRQALKTGRAYDDRKVQKGQRGHGKRGGRSGGRTGH